MATAVLRLDPQRGLVRGIRAAVLTVPAVGSAALVHALADGCGSLLVISLAAGLCWPAAVAVLGNRRRLPALVAWLLAAQLVTHLLLEWTCTAVTSGQVPLLTHLQRGVSPSMLGAHLGAVLVTAVALGRADVGLWTADAVVQAAGRALQLAPALVLPSVPDAAPGWAALDAGVPCLRDLWRAALPTRRGPPVLSGR